jgi:hypothetical protein
MHVASRCNAAAVHLTALAEIGLTAVEMSASSCASSAPEQGRDNPIRFVSHKKNIGGFDEN